MLKYRIANSTDAENLLMTRYNAVVNNGTNIYPENILKAWAPKISEDNILKEKENLNSPDRVTIVAEDCSDSIENKCKIVGLTTLIISEKSVMQCYVLKEYSKMGIGNGLMSRIENTAKEKGIKKLIMSSSLMAMEFQRKRGWTVLNQYEYDLGNDLSLTCYMMEREI